jgi:acetyltransferase
MAPHHQACPGVSKSGPHWLDTYPVHLCRSWTLASGELLLLRPIRHDDDEREERFVRGLSWESGYQRMLGAIKITAEWIERMTHIDYRRHMAFAATTMKDGGEQFVGVGRYVVDAATGNAEVALVIADAWHGKGLGRRMLELLLQHARDAGVREAEGVVLATNRTMLRLAGSVGFSLKADPEDATIVRMRRRLDDANGQPH